MIKWEGYCLHDATWLIKINLLDAGIEVQRMMQEIDQEFSLTNNNITTSETFEPDAQNANPTMGPEPPEPGPAARTKIN